MNIKFKLSFVFIIIRLIKNSEIIIPFTSLLSEIPKNLTPTLFMESLINNELFTNISLGTPKQYLNLSIDFKNYHSYIFNDSSIKNKNFKRFYYNLSSTFMNLGKKDYFYDGDFLYAINSSDIMTLNENLSNYNFTFLQIIQANYQTKIKYPGAIGFGVIPNSEPFHFEQA